MKKSKQALGITLAALIISFSACSYTEYEVLANKNFRLGENFYKLGQYKESIYYYKNALNITTKNKNPTHKSVGVLKNKVGIGYDHQQNYFKAIEYFQSALKNYELNFGSEAPDTNTVRSNLATAYFKSGQYKEAILYFEHVLNVRISGEKSNHIKIAEIYNLIGFSYFKLEVWEKAGNFFDKALTIALKEIGKDHETTKVYRSNLANAKSKMGR